MTYEEFYQWTDNLPSRFDYRDLETYLSALYSQIEKEKTQELTAEKLLILLESSFKSEPLEFKPEWLKITSAPEFDVRSLNTDLSFSEGVTFTIDVVKFQISELHKMKGKQLEDKMRYFGTTSETGNRWFNFDPFTNLECGAAWMLSVEGKHQQMNVNWKTLGVLLEMGRIYE